MTASNMVRKRYRVNWPVFISRLLLLAVVATSIAWAGRALYLGMADGLTERDRLLGLTTSTVVVQPGDSLWSIADNLVSMQGVDTRRIVDDIKGLNGMTATSVLRPGTTLVVPSNTIEPDVVLASNEREPEGRKRT